MFQDVKIGDKVWNIKYGWGEIKKKYYISGNPKPNYFTLVFSGNLIRTYTPSGKDCVKDLHPSLFWDSFEIPQKALTRPKKKVKKWRWVMRWPQNFDCICITNKFYASHTEADNTFELLQPILATEIEVEE